jgi:hypothetical protein
MSYGVFSPNYVDKAKDILLGECLVYANNTSTPVLLGATSGGSKVDITKNIIDVKYDGAYGKTKGLRRVSTVDAKVTVNYLRIDYTNLTYGIPVTVSDGTDQDGTYKEIAFDLEFASGDVLDDLTLIGQYFDGQVCRIQLDNALCVDKIELDFKEKDHVTAQIVYTGFYSTSTPTTPPIHLFDYYA